MRSLTHLLAQLNKQVLSLAFVLGAVLLTIPATAQEKPDPQEEQPEPLQQLDGPFILREKEGARDSTVVVMPVKAAPVKPKQEPVKKDEDPLSFNVLYYIFQKFKDSDIVND